MEGIGIKGGEKKERKRIEGRLGDMVVVGEVMIVDMKSDERINGERMEELEKKLGVEGEDIGGSEIKVKEKKGEER